MTAENALTLEKISSGKKLYKFAWVIEIIAAFIGVMIAWSMGFQTYQYYVTENGSFPLINLFDLVLAGLPFLMVASVELLKIPFCKLIYLNKSFKIRFLFSIVLVLVTFITFETLITGFERQFANISIQVSTPQKKLNTINQKISFREDQVSELKLKTDDSISDEVTIRRLEAEASRDSAIQALEAQKDQYLASGNQVLLDKKANLENQIERERARRDEKIKQTEKNFVAVSEEEQLRQAEARKGNDRQIEIYEQNIKRLEKNLEIQKVEKDLIKFLGGQVGQWEKDIKKYRVLIEKLLIENTKVGLGSANNLNIEITRINNEVELRIDDFYEQINEIDLKLAQNNKYRNEIARIDQKIIRRQEQYNKEIDKIDAFRDEQTKDLGDKNDRIDAIEEELVPLKEEQSALFIEITEAYEQTQIYRIAKSWYGLEDGVMISEEQISFVAKVWFGSLAGIVSTMGIFLAFGSFIFMYSGIEFKELKERKPGPLRRALINMMESRKKRYDNPEKIVKVTKEVPVEKIVKETVEVEKVVYKEVPKEIVRKEVIHVPIYTNDTDLLKFGTTKVEDILDDD
jgi:hypothetical protein